MAARWLDETPPLPGRRFAEIDAAGSIGPTTRVARRWGMPCSVERDGETATLRFPGEVMKAPAFTAPALRFIRDHAAFAVTELPGGLHDDAKQVLVRRLIGLGLLEIVVSPPSPTAAVAARRLRGRTSR